MDTSYYIDYNHIITDESVKAVVSSLNLRYLGSGISRTVYALSDTLVLKVTDTLGSGIGDCSDEVRLWDDVVGTEHEGAFAKVYAGTAKWLVMERVCCVGAQCSKCSPDAETDREHRMAYNAAMQAYGVSDQHCGNWGTTVDGRKVAIDYAYQPGYANSDISADLCNECEDCQCCSIHSACFNGTFCSCRANRWNRPDCHICGDAAIQNIKCDEFVSGWKRKIWTNDSNWGRKVKGYERVASHLAAYYRPMCAEHANRDKVRFLALFGSDGVYGKPSDIPVKVDNPVVYGQGRLFRSGGYGFDNAGNYGKVLIWGWEAQVDAVAAGW